MNKVTQRIASSIILILALTFLLSIGMGHWMNKEPMHHGDHECCNFAPMQASSSTSTLLMLPPILATIAILISSYSPILIVQKLCFTPFYTQVHRRRLFKGVVQRE